MAHEESRLGKPRFTRHRSVSFSRVELVRCGQFAPDQPLPLVVEPNVRDIDLAGWATANQDFIERSLYQHGALLLRGFDIGSVAEFEKFGEAATRRGLFRQYGDLPPEDGSEGIYQSTPYPEDKTILFHNESSHMHRWPMRQFFNCVKAAEQGGETPVVDCRRVYEALPRDLVERFEQKQLLYVRNFTEGLDISWQDFFKTDDPSQVEAYCRAASMEYEWKADGLRTLQRRPAVMRHPTTGEKVFFNQIQLHHVSCLATEVREALFSLFTPDNLPRSVYYGDGSAIEDSVVEAVIEIYWQHSTAFAWRAGDILLLDNMLVAHARNPFRGSRKIVVGMGDMVTQDDF
jgi:alpha-ketoglutarate-dependent taurine dioxygenase